MHKVIVASLCFTAAVASAQQGLPQNAKAALLPVVKAVHIMLPPVQALARARSIPVGGQEVSASVELSEPAPCTWGCGQYVNGQPSGGMPVSVSSSNPAVAQTPRGDRIVVPVGKTSQTFVLSTSPVAAPTPVTISAAREGSPAQSGRFTVYPPSLTGLAIDQTAVISGATAHGTVTFNGPPVSSGAVVATLSSGNSASVQVPSNVVLDMNKTVAPFDIKTAGVAANTTVTITASFGDSRDSATLTVTPAVLISYDGTVNLSGAAPPSGAVIKLVSADPAHVSVPATVLIPAGSSKATVSVTRHADYSEHHVKISATYGAVTKAYDEYVIANIKPDLAIKEVTLRDRFGNAITHPQDSQPYKMCVAIELLGVNKYGNYLYPLSTVLRVSYLTSTGTGTSAGHEFDVPIPFPITSAGGGFSFDEAHTHGLPTATSTPPVIWFDPTCIDMPGLPQPGSFTDVTLIVDSNNKTDESNEGNNTHKLRITRQ